jgi:hypothetical protein
MKILRPAIFDYKKRNANPSSRCVVRPSKSDLLIGADAFIMAQGETGFKEELAQIWR